MKTEKWQCCSMHDESQRRGIWYRETEEGLEIRGGREGDDCRAVLKKGEVLTEEAIRRIIDVLDVGSWMLDMYGPIDPDSDLTPWVEPRN